MIGEVVYKAEALIDTYKHDIVEYARTLIHMALIFCRGNPGG